MRDGGYSVEGSMTNSLVRLGSVLSLVAVLPAADVAAFLDRGRASWPEEFICRAHTEFGATHIFHSVGVVTAVSTATGALTLDHEDIKGLMPAMVMTYRVEPRELTADLGVGDRIAFEVEPKSYKILRVMLLQHSK